MADVELCEIGGCGSGATGYLEIVDMFLCSDHMKQAADPTLPPIWFQSKRKTKSLKEGDQGMADADYSLCEHEDCEEGAVGRYGEVSLCREHLHEATDGGNIKHGLFGSIDYGPMAADAFVPPQTEGMTRPQSRVVHEDTLFIVLVMTGGATCAIDKRTGAFVEPAEWEQVARSLALTLRDKT